MKDIINKLAQLELAAQKDSEKKVLTEQTTNEKPKTLKDTFESLAGQKPIPVVGKEGSSQQTGAGFVNVTDPALQSLGKTIGDLAAQKKLQIVVPNAQQNTTIGKTGPTVGGQGTLGIQAVTEKWGEETTVAPSEKGKYAGKNKAELTKQYNKLKASGPHKKGSPEYSNMRELSFAIRAKSDWGKVQESAGITPGSKEHMLELINKYHDLKEAEEKAYMERGTRTDSETGEYTPGGYDWYKDRGRKLTRQMEAIENEFKKYFPDKYQEYEYFSDLVDDELGLRESSIQEAKIKPGSQEHMLKLLNKYADLRDAEHNAYLDRGTVEYTRTPAGRKSRKYDWSSDKGDKFSRQLNAIENEFKTYFPDKYQEYKYFSDLVDDELNLYENSIQEAGMADTRTSVAKTGDEIKPEHDEAYATLKRIAPSIYRFIRDEAPMPIDPVLTLNYLRRSGNERQLMSMLKSMISSDTEKQYGKDHPSLAESVNRLLRKLIRESDKHEKHRKHTHQVVDKTGRVVSKHHSHKEAMAAAAKNDDYKVKTLHEGELEKEQLGELSSKTLGSYVKKASSELPGMVAQAGSLHRAKKDTKLLKRQRGIDQAVDKMTNEGAKVDRMVKHIEKSEKKAGKSNKEAENIAWATANKRGMLDNKNKKKVKEADLPSVNGVDTRGAGLGAGRSATTLENKDTKMNKKSKPDFLDMDKDGNKKEPMKKALADKKKKVVESMDPEMKSKISKVRDILREFQYDYLRPLYRSGGYTDQQIYTNKRSNSYSVKLQLPRKLFSEINYHNRDNLAAEVKEVMDRVEHEVPGVKAKINHHIVPYGYGQGSSLYSLIVNIPNVHNDSETFSESTELKKKVGEPMKKALSDKKKKTVKESLDSKITAARHEGRADGLRGLRHRGKHYDEMEESKAYHEGYKDGLDECYGMGVYEGAIGSAIGTGVGATLGAEVGGPLGARVGGGIGAKLGSDIGDSIHDRFMDEDYDMMDDDFLDEDDMEEGNAFTGALARTPRGGKFSVGGRSYTDNSSLEEYAFESRKQLGELSNKTLKSYKDKASKDYERIRKKPEDEASTKDLKNFDKRARGHTLASKKMGKQQQLDELSPDLLNRAADKAYDKGLTLDDGDSFREKKIHPAAKEYWRQEEKFRKGARDAEYRDRKSSFDADIAKLSPAKQRRIAKQDQTFESWDKQLKTLINEDEVKEGVSVSISKGQQNAPDSVTITASDNEADQLLAIVKNAGMGLFGDDAGGDFSMPQPHQMGAEAGAEGQADITVVDDNDDMLSLMGRLSGIEAQGPTDTSSSEDYADENGAEYSQDGVAPEACASCGCEDCECDDEEVNEVESEDQMEFKVSEENAPDSDEKETSADEAAEAQEDEALANKDSEEDEEDEEENVSESLHSILERYMQLEQMSEAKKKPEPKAKSEKKAEKIDEWANGIGGQGKDAEGKGTDASFERDIEFMTKVIAGGLNKPKSTGQTTIPVIAGQDERTVDSIADWTKLAGIKK